MAGLVPTIHPTACSNIRGWLAPRNKPEDGSGIYPLELEHQIIRYFLLTSSLCGQIAHGALVADLALLDHVGKIRDLRREVQILLGHQDGEAHGLQRLDLLAQLLHDDGRHAFDRLVQQQQQRIAHQRAADRQHLLLAAAEIGAHAACRAAAAPETGRRSCRWSSRTCRRRGRALPPPPGSRAQSDRER